MTSPTETILAFVNRQPQTVRDTLCLDICLGFRSAEAVRNGPIVELAHGVLTECEGILALQRCLHVIGALDQSMSRSFQSVDSVWAAMPEELLDQHPMLKKLSLAAPLRRRYQENAAAEWRRLRETALSPAELDKFQHSLLLNAVRDREI